MLLVVGFSIVIGIIVKDGVNAATITVNPPPPILYYTVGAPAAITCTVSGLTVNQQVKILILTNELFPGSVLGVESSTPQFSTFPNNTWAGIANFTWASPQSTTQQGTFSLPSIQDGSYDCSCILTDYSTIKQNFQVFTTKKPDLVITSNGTKLVGTTVDVDKDANATVTCTALNSKPGYILSWDNVFGSIQTSTLVNNTDGTTTSSISIVVPGSLGYMGTPIMCTAVPAISIPGLGAITTTATIAIIYGPADSSTNITLPLPGASVTCPLSSYPVIGSYLWTQDSNSIGCNTSTCFITPKGIQTLLTCRGSNPRTSVSAIGTINIAWTSSTGESSGSTGILGAGPIAGIVIGAVVVLVLIIVIPVVCVKRKQSKGRSDSGVSRRSTTAATPAQQSSRPYSFDNASATHGTFPNSGGYKSPMSAQPDLVRNSGFSPSTPDAGQQQKAPATPPPAYPGGMDMIDQNPRSRKPIALYDTALDDAYPNQTNASYMPSPKY